MTNNHNIRSHAPFGGSVAARRINCSASYAAEAQMPEEEASPQALEGTEAHEVCEYELANFLYHKVHGEYPDLPKPVFYEEYIEYALGYVEAVWEKALLNTITGKSYVIETDLIINDSLGMRSIVDFAAVYFDERGRNVGIVGDYKHGYSYVDADKNDQLAHNACGLREGVRRVGKDLEYVRAFIYQPRAGSDAYRETTFTAKYLDSWQRRAYRAAETIFVSQRPKFKAGDWCKWCRARAVCPTLKQSTEAETKLSLVDYRTIELPNVELLPPEHVAQLVRHGDKLIDLVEAAKKLAFEECIRTGSYCGLKVVEGNGKRGWIKDQSQVASTLEVANIDPYSKKLIGIGEAEKALKAASFDALQISNLMSTITTKSAPKVLVESSDPREAIRPNVELLEIIGE